MPKKKKYHENDYYVYIIFRKTGAPCYVGKGKGDRCFDHLRRSHNKYLRRIVAKAGGDLPIVKIAVELSETKAFEIERAFIAALGKANSGGLLVNLTDGGDGVSGHKRTGSQRQKMSEARRGQRISAAAAAKVSASLSGRPKTPEHCAAVSAAKKGKPGKPQSEATKAKRAATLRGRKRPPEEVEAIRQRHANMTPEQRAQKSERIKAALTGKKLSPEHKKKISEIQRGLVRSDEFKAKVSAGLRAAFASGKRKPRGKLSEEALKLRRAKMAAKKQAAELSITAKGREELAKTKVA